MYAVIAVTRAGDMYAVIAVTRAGDMYAVIAVTRAGVNARVSRVKQQFCRTNAEVLWHKECRILLGVKLKECCPVAVERVQSLLLHSSECSPSCLAVANAVQSFGIYDVAL